MTTIINEHILQGFYLEWGANKTVNILHYWGDAQCNTHLQLVAEICLKPSGKISVGRIIDIIHDYIHTHQKEKK
jgi:hypothetical protein